MKAVRKNNKEVVLLKKLLALCGTVGCHGTTASACWVTISAKQILVTAPDVLSDVNRRLWLLVVPDYSGGEGYATTRYTFYYCSNNCAALQHTLNID